MKRLIPISIIVILVLNGLGAVAIQEQDDKTSYYVNDEIIITTPTIIEKNGFITLDTQEGTQLLVPGKPMVPVFTKTFMFPVGTTIQASFVTIEYETIPLNGIIQPSPSPIPYSSGVFFETEYYPEIDVSVYNSGNPYPSEPYSIKYGIGINEGEHVTYVNIRCHAQYSPSNNYINVPSSIMYTIEYTEPLSTVFTETAQDGFLIITHEKFKDEMLRLKEHKENFIGIPTQVVTVDTIFESYNGVADWEEVKLYIADKVKYEGIRYVLLAGGVKGQTNEYWVPAFPSNNFDGAVSGQGVPYDPTYLSDLYFADLFSYDKLGNPLFSTWDTNNNGVYAEGPYSSPMSYDEPDYYPDVYLGRIPFRYSWEAKTIVDKIIEYETMPSEPSWFKKAVLIGGDTSPDGKPGVYEGEMVCGVTANHFESIGWDTFKMFTSRNGDHQLNNGEDGSAADEIAIVLNQGAGWVNAQSHANPAVMGNHPPESDGFIYYFTIMDMNLFTSNGKYPFMILDGCTNAFWDASIQRIISEGMYYPGMHHLKWIPTDISSWMVLRENGGGIAAIGNTALGYGYLDEHILQGLGGWLMPRFAHAYVIQGRERIGEIWTQGITDYINIIGNVLTDQIDRKTIEQRQLLGDPTIKLGGSGGSAITSISEEDDETNPDYVPANTINVPIWNVGDSWNYKLNTIDFTMQELEDRGVDIKLSAGSITLEVIEVSTQTYVTEISCDDISIEFEMTFNSYTEEPTFIEIPPVRFENVQLKGKIIWIKDTLAIDEIELSIHIDIMKNLEGLPIALPEFVYSLAERISIPAQVNLNIYFNDSWPLFQFPLTEGNEWGIPSGLATIEIGGSVQSPWLRVLNLVNKFVPLIPKEFAKYLPNVDIAEILEDYGIPPIMEIEIPYVGEVMRKAPFAVSGQETITVGAGSFDATRIKILGGIGNLYYSEEVNNFVQFYSPANDFLPAISNINLELIE